MSTPAAVIVRVRGYQFSIRAPYASGQPLGEAEACQLNDLRADNIRNNLTKMVLDELALLAQGEMLAPGQIAELQRRIAAYDAKYQLQLKHQSRPRIGAIEAEAKLIAEERLDTQLRQQGLAPEAVNYPQLLAEMEALPAVQELARERVRVRQQVVQHNLGDL